MSRACRRKAIRWTSPRPKSGAGRWTSTPWARSWAAQAVIPGMKAKACGSIINIASIFGLVGEPWAVAYCASKGAAT